MNELQFLIYTADNDSETASVIIKGETIWASQKEMARLFDVGVPAISKHLKNIFEEGELEEKVVVSKMEIVGFGYFLSFLALFSPIKYPSNIQTSAMPASLIKSIILVLLCIHNIHFGLHLFP